jgi:hypothetical protein
MKDTDEKLLAGEITDEEFSLIDDALNQISESGLEHDEKAVLQGLFTYWRRDNPCPSVTNSTIAWLCGVRTAEVRKVLRRLETKGALKLIHIVGYANRYDLSAALEGRLPKRPDNAYPAKRTMIPWKI